MANPNIVNVTTIQGKIVGAALTTTSADIVNNPAASGKIFKINSAYVSNVDGVNDATVTAGWRNAANTETKIAHEINVKAGATVVLVSKDSSIYLEEDHQFFALASANSDLAITVSYEEIS